ncbi:SGNH/GDSL hydrolase family protein [Serratia marcescens]|uniref:SGNH/GDSL hydrolase family protein n=1 Tax=Serratia marcescens TaxID=615 RepID=UPI0011870828|nr:SGNH/GDSL hydrolase family protein [Serratia marcescens]MDM1791352.1 SGNH/GDSL hydrolase family protein [Serratia marcescens]MDM1796996.1 SGNH/GDSL hydrolase family protein [Serratia marcescens]MDM1802529.1 SGNH/GDSL hydrolase family protein [Serratia marcescens]MDM1807785.1 SGNH/GDSL hydrolase family protein [Serratia marcescens]MDM1813455.1 SGNH/GDSL hydrolase family protein [Serratia marcescens]
MSNNGLPVTDVVGVSVSLGQRRTAGASSGDAYAQAAQNSAVNAAGSAANAEQSELSSADNAENAKASEISAAESAQTAKSYAEISQSAAGAYPSKAAAQDAIDKGTETRTDFIVWGVIDGDIWTERYQNINGVATPTGVTMKNGKFIDALVAAVNSLLPSYHQSPDLVAFHVDRNGQVPAWYRSGKLGFAGVESDSAQRLLNASYSFFPIQMSANLWAFGVDSKGKVPMWCRNGAWGAAAIEPDTADRVIKSARSFSSYNMSPNNVALYVDTIGQVPIRLIGGAFDAADVTQQTANIIGDKIGATGNVAVRSTSGSTLYSMRIKKAKLKKGVSGRLVGMAVGDSWSEFYNISQALANRMYADWGPRAGAGWFQLITDPSSRWENMIVTRSGWTEYDASYSNAQPPYGCGVDGIAYYTSANNATASITNVKDTTGTVFYYDGTGTFVIGVGATTKTVVGTGSGEYRSTSIPGLTSGLDTVTITTTGNTGVVCLHGFVFETELNSGCLMHKCGNGGTWAAQHTIFITPRIQFFAQKLNPDFIVVNLGTNDFLQSRTTETYITGLNGIIDSWRAILPDVGIILVSPPVPNAEGRTPMVDFRNAMRNVARDKRVEWYDLYDDMPKDWATGNAMGWWKDSYHPNDVGAEQIVNTMFELLLDK